MWMIEALAYTVIALQPIGEPRLFRSQVTFQNIDACQTEMKSERFVMSRLMISERLRQEAEAALNPDEPAIVPDIAITAHCVPDERL